MSATTHRTLVAIEGGGGARPLDRSALRWLGEAWDLLTPGEVEVLDDADGDSTRFLCRAATERYAQPETFMAAAVRRYFNSVGDPRLAQLMFQDALSQDFVAERVTRTALRAHMEACLHGPAPAAWFEHMRQAGALHAMLLHTQAGRLEILCRSPRYWLYGLLEE